MRSNRQALSTKPVARGDRYCSPACGAGCTKAQHDAAVAAGAALAKQLGDGWRAQVWENLGWHYRAFSVDGRIKVHPNIHQGKVQTYLAFLGEPGQQGGKWSEHGKTPKDAVKEVKRVALAELTEAANLLDMKLVPAEGS